MNFIFRTNEDASVVKLAERMQQLNDFHPGEVVAYLFNIKIVRPIRSNDQNRYYRAILKEIANESGYTTEDLHKMYGQKFNSKYVLDELVPRSTTELDTREMTIYINKVKEHAKEFYNCKFRELKDKKYLEWEAQTSERYDRTFASI